jgi:hypothetical protein
MYSLGDRTSISGQKRRQSAEERTGTTGKEIRRLYTVKQDQERRTGTTGLV